jgi:hypothetical protein
MTQVIAAAGRQGALILQLIALSFRAQWIFYVVPLVYLGTNWMMLSSLPSYGKAPLIELLLDLVTFSIPVGLTVALIVRLIQYAVFEKPESPVRALAGDVGRLLRSPAHIINALPVFFAMVFFNKAMVELKPAIPALKPFSYDTAMMAFDRLLHFGTDPWVLLQPVLGYGWVTFLVNIAYNFWFIALFGAWFWFGFHKQASELRTRFFLSYMLSWWIGGGLLAVFFSSAGPCYYSLIGLTPDPFAPLMAYHQAVDQTIPLWFLDTQTLLWDGYQGKTLALGISAFPSMHNASAILFALAFRHVNKGLGRFFGVYALIILVGSVHLGWHYAVDGYAGILIGLVSWKLAEPVARWFTNLSTTRRFNEGLASL